MTKQKSIIVVGAGIGGLAAAAKLAQKGQHVTVFDKNSHAGGRFDRITRNEHHFDTGPTLMVMPHLYESEFSELGVNLWNDLVLLRVDPTYHLVFDDGSSLALTSDMKSMYDQLEQMESGSFEGFLRYYAEGSSHYRIAMKKLVNIDFRVATEFFSLRNLPLIFQVKPLSRHYRRMERYFRSPRLKAAFTFQDVYMGLSPFEAMATFSMMPYTELAHGVWYPKGGMYSLVRLLEDVAKNAGVEFVYDAEVMKIDVNRESATGIILADRYRQKADVVLANADLPYVYNELLPDNDLGVQMSRKRFSCSVISFFWGIDRAYPNLPPHTLFLADDYRQNFESIEKDLTLPVNPSLYIHAPTRLDPELAPPSEDTLIAIVPVGHLGDHDDRNWKEIILLAKEKVFERLRLVGINDLQEHIKFEICFTPLSWQKRYNLMKGATHGLSHTLMQLGYLRPRNRHPRYHNLYFAGASTHPGTGVPTALVSARLAANRIMDEIVILPEC